MAPSTDAHPLGTMALSLLAPLLVNGNVSLSTLPHQHALPRDTHLGPVSQFIWASSLLQALDLVACKLLVNICFSGTFSCEAGRELPSGRASLAGYLTLTTRAGDVEG